MRIRRRLLVLVSAMIGVALFVYVVRQTGVAEIGARLRSLGFGFLLILAISALRYLARSLAWRRCMAPEDRRLGTVALWRARLAGEALGDLTFGPVVAEPLRLVALGDRLSLSSGISSLAVENIAYAVSSCLLVMAGAMIWLANFGLNGAVGTAIWVSLSLVSTVVIASLALIGYRVRLVSGAGTALKRTWLGQGTRGRMMEETLRNLREAEEYVFDFFSRRPFDFLLVIFCELAFHLGGVIEIYATLRMIGLDLTLAAALMLESVNRAINIAFIFVPVLVGVDETGTGLVAAALGLGGAAGVTLAIIRKIRMFFWIGVGLIFWAVSRKDR